MSAAQELRARAQDLVLASTLATYPDEELVEILDDLGDAHPGGAAMQRASRAPAGLSDLRSRYLELFDRGGQRASLYETEYGRMRGMSKGRDLADIAGFYQAFGMLLEDDEHEMLDHVAVELEFYAVLLLKQAALLDLRDPDGGAIVEEARRKFLAEHLGSLARAIAARTEVIADPVYAEVFAWCWRVVGAECAVLGVTPAPLDFFPDEESRKEMKCGAVHLPVVQ